MAYEELGRKSEAIADYKKYVEIGDNPKLVKYAKLAIEELRNH